MIIRSPVRTTAPEELRPSVIGAGSKGGRGASYQQRQSQLGYRHARSGCESNRRDWRSGDSPTNPYRTTHPAQHQRNTPDRPHLYRLQISSNMPPADDARDERQARRSASREPSPADEGSRAGAAGAAAGGANNDRREVAPVAENPVVTPEMVYGLIHEMQQDRQADLGRLRLMEETLRESQKPKVQHIHASPAASRQAQENR